MWNAQKLRMGSASAAAFVPKDLLATPRPSVATGGGPFACLTPSKWRWSFVCLALQYLQR